MKKFVLGVILAAFLSVMSTQPVAAYLTPIYSATSGDGIGTPLIDQANLYDGDDNTYATSAEVNYNGAYWSGFPVSIPEGYLVAKVIVTMLTDGVNELDSRAQCISSDWMGLIDVQSYQDKTTGPGMDLTTFVLDDNTNQDCFWSNNHWYNFSDGATFLFGTEVLTNNYLTPNKYAEAYVQMQYCSVLGGECSEEILEPSEAPYVEVPNYDEEPPQEEENPEEPQE